MTQHLNIRLGSALRGSVRVPGDKSISHRAVMLGALADGPTAISGFLPANDCLATIGCMRALGIDVEQRGATAWTVRGRGLRSAAGRLAGGLAAPSGPLDCGGSGTTMRLLAGILAGQPFAATLSGNAQLSRRPMGRVAEPLREMGGHVALGEDGRPPIVLLGGARLRAIDYRLPVASAQVKSAVLLAGLFAEGATTVREAVPSRDHTERMLQRMSVEVVTRGDSVQVCPPERLEPLESYPVPGDFSSAAFLIVAATLVPHSDVRLDGVGFNPTRTGLVEVLRVMGADMGWLNTDEASGEPATDLIVRAAELAGTQVGGALVPRMIDEFPVLAVAATQAQGVTEVRDAAELRVKETDRIAVLVAELRKLGAHIEPLEDGFVVEGPTPLRGAVVDSHGDHRLAMALAVAGLVAAGETVVEGIDCVDDSFPGFVETLARLGANVAVRS